MEAPFPEIGNPKFITEFDLERLTLAKQGHRGTTINNREENTASNYN